MSSQPLVDRLDRSEPYSSVGIAPFVVLFVCTGNICRSPMAEVLFGDRLDRSIRSSWPKSTAGNDALRAGSPFLVRSAGTGVDAALEQPVEVAEQLRRLGAPLVPHTTRALTAEMLEDVDLVIGMTREHRRAAVKLAPRLVTKAFTLVEYARIVDSFRALPVDESTPQFEAPDVATFLRLTSTRASRRRGMVQPPSDAKAFDIADPYRRKAEVYTEVADTISKSVDEIVNALTELARR
jgi:protein-tyrosine phosphatase